MSTLCYTLFTEMASQLAVSTLCAAIIVVIIVLCVLRFHRQACRVSVQLPVSTLRVATIIVLLSVLRINRVGLLLASCMLYMI